MKTIIQKAIEGGWKKELGVWNDPKDVVVSQLDDDIYFFEDDERVLTRNMYKIVCDPLFWQALFKTYISGQSFYIHQRTMPQWKQFALRFHEINLTEGWDKAVEYLNNLIK